jgi:hypothetical protein
MAYLPESSSVVAFQSDYTKLKATVSVVGTVDIGKIPGSVAAVQKGDWIISGSVATVGTAVANQSISGTVDIGVIPGSVVAFPTGNQSISGTVNIAGNPSISGTVNIAGVTIPPGSISGTVDIGVSPGSVVVFSSKPSSILVGASVYGNIGAYQIGTWGASITGTTFNAGSVAAVQMGTWTVGLSGYNSSVQILNGSASVYLQAGVNPIGSVTTLQGTNPWVISTNSGSVIATQIAGSVMNVNISGSVATVGTAAANQSVSGTVGASIIGLPYFGVAGSVATVGSITALQGTNPWIVNMPSSSVIAYQLAGSVMATSATVTTGPSSVELLSTSASISTLITNQLQGVSSVMLFGSTNTSVVALISNQLTGVSSVMLFGSTNTSVACAPSGAWRSSVQVLSGYASVYLQAGVATIGSVTTLQGTNPWIVSGTTSMVGAVNISGSVLIQSANNSILTAGTYLEDATHTYGDRGAFTLALRNDTLASVTTTDGDYSPFVVGPSGETIVANSPITKWVSVTTSVMTGPSIAGLPAPGASIFTYVSGVQVTNPGTVAAHVAFYEGLGGVPASILFYAMAPAGGGSNMVFPNPIKTVLANKAINASVSAHASVYVMMEGFTVQQLT